MASKITPSQVCAAVATYSIARSVVDELMPATGELSDAYDEAVFKSVLKALKDREGSGNNKEVGNG